MEETDGIFLKFEFHCILFHNTQFNSPTSENGRRKKDYCFKEQLTLRVILRSPLGTKVYIFSIRRRKIQHNRGWSREMMKHTLSLVFTISQIQSMKLTHICSTGFMQLPSGVRVGNIRIRRLILF